MYTEQKVVQSRRQTKCFNILSQFLNWSQKQPEPEVEKEDLPQENIELAPKNGNGAVARLSEKERQKRETKNQKKNTCRFYLLLRMMI